MCHAQTGYTADERRIEGGAGYSKFTYHKQRPMKPKPLARSHTGSQELNPTLPRLVFQSTTAFSPSVGQVKVVQIA